MTSPATEAFRGQYDANSAALQRGELQALPPVQMLYDGAPALSILNMRLQEVDGDRTTFFDIATGPALLPLSELAAVPTTFAQDNEWTNYTAANQALITLPPAELVDRKKLFTLGHEIGHTYDTPLIIGALTCAAQTLVTPQTEKDLEIFEPAVEALTDTVSHLPNLRDEIQRLLASNVPHVSEVTETLTTNIDKYYTEYPAASVAISALRESAAWLRVISFVSEDRLHPGMTSDAMHQEAIANAQTHDRLHDTNLHKATLLYALATFGM